jgi:formate-dependent nitrite reductase cytochrome c552 subunit
MVTLCKGCHEIEHSRLNSVVGVEITSEIQQLGFRAKHFEAMVYMLRIGANLEYCVDITKKRLDEVNKRLRKEKDRWGWQVEEFC